MATKADKNKKSATCGVTDYVDNEISVLKKLTAVKNKFLFDQFNNLKTQKGFITVSSWNALIKFLT